MPVALITGGSAGLGRALARALAEAGWRVIVDGRDARRLAEAADHSGIVAVAGDVADDGHRGALATAVEREGRLDLLVHNASTLGPTPLPRLAATTAADLQEVWRTNVGAPLALTADLLPRLVETGGTLLSISSDAGVEHYEGWGLYGATKAALDHLTLTFGTENPGIRAYAVDPGDMRTQMQQDAFPGEDVSDRPLPETVVPHLLALLARRPPSGRYRAVDVPAGADEPVGG
jgi:NAD(P)-dependent dehydrogenase (short-subunit alcohol dehydrogenase family)